ncbi:MAG: hypothetical protein AAGC60_13670 [Acidobacteriota bacterium]
MKFVQKSGTWSVQTGGRSDTPILEMPNITKGNTLKVTATFLAKTAGQANSGFTYTIQSTKGSDAQALSAQQSVVQGNAGFQTTTKTVFFEALISSQTGVEEVDFEVIFNAGEFDGAGEISDFLLTGEIVSLQD